jgi:hypothetical protein
MKSIFAVFVRACVYISIAWSTSSSAVAVEWKKYHYPEYNFEVEFSGPVQVTPRSIAARERIVRSTLYLQDGGSYSYSVLVQLNNEGVEANLDAVTADKLELYQCKNVNALPLEFSGGHAKELIGDQCLDGSYRAHARYFSKGDWFYALTYLIKIDGGDISSAQRFLRSFKIDEN